MQKSAARMSAMIDNGLDFARGRLGSGTASIIDNPNALDAQRDKQILDIFRLAISRNQRVQFSECECGISPG
jgi:hypothetical protein